MKISPAVQSPFLDFSVFTEWVRNKRIFQWSRENREGWKTQPTFLPRLLVHNIKSWWSLLLAWTLKGGSYPMMPCLFWYFSGVWGRRRAKLSSDKMLSPLDYSLMHTRLDMKNVFQRWTLLCRKDSFPGNKTKISAFKIHASKNYGLPFIT